MRQTLARISSWCSIEQCRRNRGSVVPGKRRQSRSPSTAPNTAVLTECTALPQDGTPANVPFGRQSLTTIVLSGENSRKWSTTGRASLWMRQRAASIGASLKKAKRASLRKSQMSTSPKTVSIANDSLVRRLSFGENVPTTSEVVSPAPMKIEEEQKQLEDELMFYVHNFGPNCDDDLEIENSIGVAIGRDSSSESALCLGQFHEDASWPNLADEMKL